MKGNQHPRIQIEPDRTSTDGIGASMLMDAYGVSLDEYQQIILDCWLGKDENGTYTVTSGGLSLSRQNGKTEIIIARCFYGLLINGERMIYSAHQMRTCKRVFARLESMFTDRNHPEVINDVKKIYYGTGAESIELKNGGRIEFCARSTHASRGYDGISLVVIDEAAEAEEMQIASIMATLSASSTGTRQILYVGSPPYEGCAGDVFRHFREKCILSDGQGNNKRNSWHEWSIVCDDITKVDLSNKTLWYECNPSLGTRLTEEFTEEEFRTLGMRSFATERLGYWAPPKESISQGENAIDQIAWDKCATDSPKPEGKTAYGIKFSPDGSEVVLAGAVIENYKPSSGGRIGTDMMFGQYKGEVYRPSVGEKARIEVIAVEPTGRGLQWLADWLNERSKIGCCVVIDGKNGTDVLIDKIKDVWRFKDSVIKPTAQNVITATAMLVNEINEQSVSWYIGQEGLRESAISAKKRPISGGWGFGGQGCIQIEACSLALYGVRTSKRNPQKTMRIG